MEQLMDTLQNMSIHELEKLKSIIDKQINLKKEIDDLLEGRVTKLQQGKRQPIAMFDNDGNLIREFNGFNACSNYIREILEERNEQNKLRDALENGTSIQGYKFKQIPPRKNSIVAAQFM